MKARKESEFTAKDGTTYDVMDNGMRVRSGKDVKPYRNKAEKKAQKRSRVRT